MNSEARGHGSDLLKNKEKRKKSKRKERKNKKLEKGKNIYIYYGLQILYKKTPVGKKDEWIKPLVLFSGCRGCRLLISVQPSVGRIAART